MSPSKVQRFTSMKKKLQDEWIQKVIYDTKALYNSMLHVKYQLNNVLFEALATIASVIETKLAVIGSNWA